MRSVVMTTQTKSMQDLWQDSYLAAGNEEYLESLYDAYLENPSSVSAEWQRYFDQLLQQMARVNPDVSHAAIREQFLQLAKESVRAPAAGMEIKYDQKQELVIELINAYRRVGHLHAEIDP